MQPDVPAIYYRSTQSHRVLGPGRLLAASIALVCLALLIVASRLSPNHDGLGTHRQLGLEECGWLRATGLPCPACGMTTSFAWFVRGNLLASTYVQPMGALLAAAVGMMVWAGLYIAITARPVHRLFAPLSSRNFVVPLLAFTLLAWGWKIYIHLHQIDGWE